MIIAVDPGTTIGIAALNLDGDIVKVFSSKNLNVDDVVKKIREYGIPIILSNDKSYLPVYLEKIRSAYNLKVILPKKDLLIKVKQELIKWYGSEHPDAKKDIGSFLTNSHEKDAFASAVFAYRKLYPTIKKIEYFLDNNDYFNSGDKEKDMSRKNTIRKEVLQNDKSIFSVYEELLRRDLDEDVDAAGKDKKDDKAIPEIQPKDNSVSERKKTTEDILRDHIDNLKAKIRVQQRENNTFKRMISKILSKESYKEKSDRRVKVKNKEISICKKEIDRLKDELYVEKREKEDLYKTIPSLNEHYLVWKADKITQDCLKDFFEQSKEKDLILIKDVNGFSADALKRLKKRTDIIISDQSNRRIKEDFIVIDPKKLKLERLLDKFFIVKKGIFDREKDSSDILKKIIDDYRNERKIEK